MKYTKAIKLWHNGLLKKLPNTNYFEVREVFSWFVDYNNKKEIISVSEWFKTNFWSIPKPLRIFFNPTKYIGYILHDYLYSDIGVMYNTSNWNELYYSRKDADQILLATLHLEWAGFIERTLVYIWVRIWWGLFYKK